MGNVRYEWPAWTAAPQQLGARARPISTLARKPSISVVIPAFNEAGYIEHTIRSILDAKARYKGEVEIVVVDNSSTDATADIARGLGANVVFEPVNQIARARNTGAKAAIGDCLVFLDADTRLEGDIFDKVAANLSSGEVIGGGAWVEPSSGWMGRLLFKFGINYLLSLKNVTVGPFLYCARAAFLRVGGFDEELYAGEEFSLARRLKAEGSKHNQRWMIIKNHKAHRIVTSSRNFNRFGVLGMAFKNVHLIWRPGKKLRQKVHCRFWYAVRRQ